MYRPSIFASALALTLSACTGQTSQTLPQARSFSQASLRSAAIPNTVTYEDRYNFGATSTDGQSPYAGLIDVAGVLYGTTSAGGTRSDGTVFSLTTGGTETVLHDFTAGDVDGSEPYGTLVEVDGVFYGTTYAGGANGDGSVYSITPGGTESVLFSFDGTNGANPMAGLIAVKGVLYGTTYDGGANDLGTVFAITTAGTETVLHSFSDSSTDGRNPWSGLIEHDGVLYGTTPFGGESGAAGTVYQITTGGTESLVYSFNGSNGSAPDAKLIAVNGTFYGTTADGGTNAEGTVFSLTTGGTLTTIHSFGTGTDGTTPVAGLVVMNGVLYGATIGGTTTSTTYGTVYSITTGGTETVLHGFAAGDGEYPNTTPIVHSGILYGTTELGGTHDDGIVYSVTP
jgi:uncharacterized repeat protein (TIGR03803 family)